MAHVRWHATVHLFLFRIPTLHMKILTPVQDPNASNTKPCAVNPYDGAATQKCQQFLMLFQGPNASNTHPYACTGSQQFRQFLMPGKPPDNSKNSLHN
ncbi:hypothetical protein O181_015198 [Austropuccinia psidii MF-1]|uniref:Secreted protein n=1 Tax=Austropuccinia psidii MF-1 TaxID=1389203 RepID=A0A9Q3C2Q8_9BASI|nr:hypothetical protein [Austropuccinia psidii MF-1]